MSMTEFKNFRTEKGGGGDLHVYLFPVCTWLTYNAYDYSAGYVFGIMKPVNHLPIVF